MGGKSQEAKADLKKLMEESEDSIIFLANSEVHQSRNTGCREERNQFYIVKVCYSEYFPICRRPPIA